MPAPLCLPGRVVLPMTSNMREQIRWVLTEQARLPVPVETLTDDDDLYQAGLASHASVGVMLGLEEAFDVEFPDAMLTRGTFQSVSAMAAALSRLRPTSPA